MEVARPDQVELECTREDFYLLDHVCVRELPEVAEQSRGCLVQLVVQALHQCLAEDALAQGVAVRTAHQDAPATRRLFDPVERVNQASGTARAYVQGVIRRGARRVSGPPTRPSRCVRASPGV